MKRNILFLLILLAVFFPGQVLQADINDGLVAYYPFDGNANDTSGNNNDGTEYGGVNYQTGVFGQAASFDGLDDFIRVPDSLPLRLSNTDFTLSLWVYEKSRDVSYVDALLCKRGTGNNNGWIFSITGEIEVVSPTGTIHYRVSSGTDPYATSNNAIPLNSWHHVLLVYRNSNQSVEMYIDGNFDSTTSNIPSPNPNTLDDLFIGRDSSDMYEYYFDGYIDEARIYNRALIESEIQELYKEGLDLQQGLVAYYPFDGNANDASGNGNHGNVYGPVLSEDRFGNPNGSYQFDGIDDYIEINNSPELNINDYLSIVAWVKTPVVQNEYAVILARETYGVGNRQYKLNFDQTGIYPQTVVDTETVPAVFAISDESIISDDWHLVAMTFNKDDALKIYVDGVLRTEEPVFSPSVVIDSNIVIGTHAHLPVGNGYFNGSIDEIKIYNRVLSESEIQALFSEGDTGLIAYYPFNGDAADESGNGNDGTVYGATLTTDRFGNPDSAYEFDGVSNYIEVPDDDSFDAITGQNDFCLNAWVNFSSNIPNYHYTILEQYESLTNSWHWYYKDNSIRYGYHDLEWNAIQPVPWFPELNKWYNLTINRSGNEFSIYVDGNLYYQGTFLQGETIVSPNAPINIGYMDKEGQGFDGKIDDIRIFNYALNDDAIKSLSTYRPFDAPILSCPENSSLDIDPMNIVLGWLPVSDPDGGQVEYCVNVEEADSETLIYANCQSGEQLFENRLDLSEILQENLGQELQYGTTYSWYVTARESSGFESEESAHWNFTTVASNNQSSTTLLPGWRTTKVHNPFDLPPNIVYIVHGWNSSSDADWVQTMKLAIEQQIDANPNFDPTEWRVLTLDWREAAAGWGGAEDQITDNIIDLLLDAYDWEFLKDLPVFSESDLNLYNLIFNAGFPQHAYLNASVIGKDLGKELVKSNLNHIHFIAHSAGSNLIESASEEILKANNPPTIHCTFLDAYDPAGDKSRYGAASDWADQYLDTRTLLQDYLDTTDTFLNNAYNEDVTSFDLRPSPSIEEKHSFPCDFYTETTATSSYIGFPFSWESTFYPGVSNEEWVAYNMSHYPIGYPFDQKVVTEYFDPPLVIDLLDNLTISATGNVSVIFELLLKKLFLETGSPVWTSMDIDVIDPTNILKFDYEFVSEGEGLLTVIFDDKIVFKADERFSDEGVNTIEGIWIGDVELGQHKLAFRLDPFGENPSAIKISDIQTGERRLVSTNDIDDDSDSFTENQGDCDDTNSSIYPGATEIPYDGIDQDCNGSDLTDVDGDGFAAIEAGGTDCNDDDPSINPDAKEICDGVDNNCNGLIDDGVYALSEFKQPINMDGSSIFKIKRTVPVKLSVSDCSGNNVDDAMLAISIQKLTDQVLGTYEEIVVEDAGLANDNGIYFRYSETDQHYIYNWSTKGLSAGTYRIKATAETGDFTFVSVSLK